MPINRFALMDILEERDLAIVINKIEGVQLMRKTYVVKIFMSTYAHQIDFDSESDAVFFYEEALNYMKYL